jgi:hypothetical protein
MPMVSREHQRCPWVGGNLHDPMLLPAAALLLCLVAAIACLLPALWAAHFDPHDNSAP